MLSQYPQSLLSGVLLGVARPGRSAAVCDPNPPRPFRDLEIVKNPQTLENKEESDHLLEILEIV